MTATDKLKTAGGRLGRSITALRVVLIIVGALIMVLGFDIGFGGIRTLGLQTSSGFVTVSNAQEFSIQDSHIRFLGGVWLGIGLVFVLGAFALRRLHNVLGVLTALIFIGGLARFSSFDISTLFSLRVLPSLLAELLLAPLLGYWIWRLCRNRWIKTP